MTSGWRTVIIERHERLELGDEQLIIRDEEQEMAVPLEHVRDLLIMHPSGSVTLALLQRLAEEGVNVVLCNQRYEPSAQLISIGSHLEAAGHLFDQMEWTEKRKDSLWRQIVRQKINMQAELLGRRSFPHAKHVRNYAKDVHTGDSTNREGLAAKAYFASLFGEDFVRHAVDSTNAALNYGYTILNTAVSRVLVAHGYNTAIGIHHCSRTNPVNLSCDLMEPFRPLVDAIVVGNIGRELDWQYKKALIGILQCTCRLDGREYKLGDAFDLFVVQAMDAMRGERRQIGVIGFA